MITNTFSNEAELISVLMAVYNTDVVYLREAINSVLCQSYRKIELVIIDDCSDKIDTCMYLNGLHDERIRVFRNDKNEGLTRCLIKGVQLCSGTYIARLDADDVALPKRLEYQYKYAKKKEVSFVGCNWYYIPSRRKHPISLYDNEAYKIVMIFGNQGPLHSTFFWDKNKLLSLGINYNEDYKTSQDYCLLCDCLSNGIKMGGCPKVLIGWREHSDQLSRTVSDRQKKDADSIRRNYISSNFKISDFDLSVFINYLDNRAYEKVADCKLLENTLHSFVQNNNTKLIDYEIHKYWLLQSIKRITLSGNYDFAHTELFKECLRPDRLIYSVYYLFLERKHIFVDYIMRFRYE